MARVRFAAAVISALTLMLSQRSAVVAAAAPAYLVADLNRTQAEGSQIELATAGTIDDVLLFGAAAGSAESAGLWRSDGSAAGTSFLARVSIVGGATVGTRFVFAGFDLTGPALWSSDGSPEGTERVTSIRSGPWALTPTAAALFLTLEDEEAGAELWRSDGTSAGTFRVRDLTPGALGTEFGRRVAFGAELAFIVDTALGSELWRSDGTTPGTTMITAWRGSRNRVRDLIDVDGQLYLDVGGLAPRSELWRSDGTADGTALVAVLGGNGPATSIVWLADGPGALFFAAGEEATGVELWRSDGTATGTGLVRDILRGAGSGLAVPGGLPLLRRAARAGRVLVVVADDGESGPEAWRSDGSEAGTTLLRDIDPRERDDIEDFELTLTPVGDQVMFAPRDRDGGIEPWITDGTAAGTRRVADIAPGPRSSLRQGQTFGVTRSHVFMAADDGQTGSELWAVARSALESGTACAGDCDGDGRVAIAELVRAVGIALGAIHAGACPHADQDGDGAVSIAELVTAVGAALEGCTAEP